MELGCGLSVHGHGFVAAVARGCKMRARQGKPCIGMARKLKSSRCISRDGMTAFTVTLVGFRGELTLVIIGMAYKAAAAVLVLELVEIAPAVTRVARDFPVPAFERIARPRMIKVRTRTDFNSLPVGGVVTILAFVAERTFMVLVLVAF